MTTLAIGIGGTKLAAVLIGADGQVRGRRKLPMPVNQALQALYGALPALVSPSQIHAQWVAIISTGIIRNGSLLALNPHNLGGLSCFPLVKTLEQLANLPIIVINDAQIVAWAEYQALDGNITGMVFTTVSTGVDGGVASGDKLRVGLGGLAGHTGHALTDPYDPVCGCGRTDCVEATAPGRGIAATAQGELTGMNAKTISTCAGQGDEWAQQLIHRSARTLARLIVDIKAITDYQCVVVDDSVSPAGGCLALVETYLAQGLAALHVDSLAVHYRHDAGLFGVVLLVQGGILRRWMKHSHYRLPDYILRYRTY